MGAAALCIALCLLARTAFAVGAGDIAPAFTLRDARGDTISLAGLRGQAVYIDFWASWCGPCRRSFPWMNEMHQRYGGRGLVIVAVNVDRSRADAERFLQNIPAQFRVAYDSEGVTPRAYAVKDMPSSYLVDVEQGFRDERKSMLEQRIRALIAAR